MHIWEIILYLYLHLYFIYSVIKYYYSSTMFEAPYQVLKNTMINKTYSLKLMVLAPQEKNVKMVLCWLHMKTVIRKKWIIFLMHMCFVKERHGFEFFLLTVIFSFHCCLKQLLDTTVRLCHPYAVCFFFSSIAVKPCIQLKLYKTTKIYILKNILGHTLLYIT